MWPLKGGKQRIFQNKVLEGGFLDPQGSVNGMWAKIAKGIETIAKDTLDKSRGFGHGGKESWLWNEMYRRKLR